MPQIICSKETSHADHYYRLVVTVQTAVDIDENIFLYVGLPLRPGAEDREAIFQGVCSPKDMVDWPATDPLPNAEPPWCRHNRVDLLLPSLYELNKTWDLLQEEIDTLCLTMGNLEVLTESEVVGFSHV